MLRRRTTTLGIAAAALATLATAATAAADELVATPQTGILGLGLCVPLTPCTLQDAVAKASGGDTIVLMSGKHQLTAPLELPAGVSIVGEPGKLHAELGATLDLLGPTLTVRRGTVRHLQIASTGLGQPAIRVRDSGTVEDVAAVSLTGPAVRAEAETGDVLLRDSALVSRASSAGVAALHLEGDEPIAVRNLTVWAAFGAGAIRCEDDAGQTTIRNTLARGDAYDVKGDPAGCAVAFSGVRPAKVSGVTLGAGNVGDDPRVGNESQQDFRPKSTSPLIDAGTPDPLLGAKDLDGRPRTLGTAPDIGAYESTTSRPVPDPEPEPDPVPDPGTDPVPDPGTPDPGPGPEPGPKPTQPQTDAPGKSGEPHGQGDAHKATPATPATPAKPAAEDDATPATPAEPALGRSVVLDATGKGTVKVKLPGRKGYVALADAEVLPVGTVVDASKGTVELTSELPGGRTQTGSFSGGAFQVRQPKDARGMTDIVLTGGSFADCAAPPKRTPTVTARAAAATATKKKRGKAVRKLWASDEGGRFRTHGAESVTTVRGTRWLTEDRCDGTFTKVTAGAVDVRARRTGKVTRVRAGRELLVPRSGTR